MKLICQFFNTFKSVLSQQVLNGFLLFQFISKLLQLNIGELVSLIEENPSLRNFLKNESAQISGAREWDQAHDSAGPSTNVIIDN